MLAKGKVKILMIGTDRSVLDIDSSTAKRAAEYGSLVEKIIIAVPNSKKLARNISENVNVVSAGGKNKIFQFFKMFSLLYCLAKKEKFDLATIQDPYYLALIGLLLKWRFKIGLHIQVHGWEKFGGLRSMVSKFVLSKADSIRTVNLKLKNQLVNEFRVQEDKILVIPIFVELPKLDLGNIKKDRNKFIFLTVGRLVSVKNIKMQIEAMKIFLEKAKLSEKIIELWIAGDGEEKKALETLIDQYQLGNIVKFLGKIDRDELNNIYRQADVFLLTSNAEGWPLVILEAAGFKLPIIMTDVGSAGELIISGENGIVIPIGDVEQLANAMIELFGNERMRKSLGENAYTAVAKERSKEEILELYKKSWEKAVLNKE